MVFGNFFALAFLFSLKTPNFAFGEDRLRLNNSQNFFWHCVRLALSLPSAKIGRASTILKIFFGIVFGLHYLCMFKTMQNSSWTANR